MSSGHFSSSETLSLRVSELIRKNVGQISDNRRRLNRNFFSEEPKPALRAQKKNINDVKPMVDKGLSLPYGAPNEAKLGSACSAIEELNLLIVARIANKVVTGNLKMKIS